MSVCGVVIAGVPPAYAAEGEDQAVYRPGQCIQKPIKTLEKVDRAYPGFGKSNQEKHLVLACLAVAMSAGGTDGWMWQTRRYDAYEKVKGLLTK